MRRTTRETRLRMPSLIRRRPLELLQRLLRPLLRVFVELQHLLRFQLRQLQHLCRLLLFLFSKLPRCLLRFFVQPRHLPDGPSTSTNAVRAGQVFV